MGVSAAAQRREALPLVFRSPMRSRRDDVPTGIAVERALTLGLCGLGGRLDPAPLQLDIALQLAATQHGERLARRIERFSATPNGSLVWTRDIDGLFWLGEVSGAWRYDKRPEAVMADLVHVRPCRWIEAPIDDQSVPAAVRHSFARGGRNWQGIHLALAAELSLAIWAEKGAHP